MKKLTVGQELWWVPRGKYRQASSVCVIKVGRKWATLNNDERIGLVDWIADAGEYTSTGRCYESQSVYEQAIALEVTWSEFRAYIARSYLVPDNATIENIAAVKAMLFGISKDTP